MDEKQKGRSFQMKEKALAALNEGDKGFPLNPGRFMAERDEAFEKLFEASLKGREFKAGQIVQGKIMDIRGDFVVIDIGFKSEGLISKSEFRFAKDKEELKVGQSVEVYIDCIEDDNGMVSLSKDKADISKAWQDIIHATENKETVKGTVIAQVRGGLSVDIGVKAFLPGSQVDVRPVKDLKSLIGKTFDFQVIKVNQKRGNIVLSRRSILEKERESLFQPFESFTEGAVVKGIVKNITDYGAFIDLGDIDGLLHITDISWSRLKHPSDQLRVGQEVTVKILKFEREKNRISLGIKQLNDETWFEEANRAAKEDFVLGKVVKLMDYGAFIVLKNGLEGLVHINEISWTKKIKNPARVLEVGQEVKLKVIDIQRDTHKLSFSIRQTEKNPWQDLAKNYSVGDILELPIASISEFGIFLTAKEGIDGLVHVSDISWTESARFSEKYKLGDKIKVKVLDINSKEGRFSLGIKQLTENPWDTVEEKYPIGSRHEVEVTHIVDFGVFVKLQENIEGLIHISELSRKRVQTPRDIVKEGDKILAEILSIDKESKKIGLSHRLVEGGEEQKTDKAGEGSRQTGKGIGFMENIFAKALKGSLLKNEETSPKESSKSKEQKTDEKAKASGKSSVTETANQTESKKDTSSGKSGNIKAKDKTKASEEKKSAKKSSSSTKTAASSKSEKKKVMPVKKETKKQASLSKSGKTKIESKGKQKASSGKDSKTKGSSVTAKAKDKKTTTSKKK